MLSPRDCGESPGLGWRSEDSSSLPLSAWKTRIKKGYRWHFRGSWWNPIKLLSKWGSSPEFLNVFGKLSQFCKQGLSIQRIHWPPVSWKVTQELCPRPLTMGKLGLISAHIGKVSLLSSQAPKKTSSVLVAPGILPLSCYLQVWFAVPISHRQLLLSYKKGLTLPLTKASEWSILWWSMFSLNSY